MLVAEQALRRFMQGRDNVYNSGDPFFIVVCNRCGKEYWSTRGINVVCIRCGSKDISTNKPEHTIERYKNITK